jgi:membrane protease YdiL (CAAX protease family)
MTEEQLPVPAPPPEPEPERFPFWGYADVLLVAGLSLPCMFVGLVVVGLAMWALKLHTGSARPENVPAMVIGYVLLFMAVKVIFRVQYDRPFWRSLGWTESRLPFYWNVACGFGTSLLVALVAVLIYNPPVKGPIVEMMKDRHALILLAVFGTTAAPLFEELAFRGLLQPLLEKSIGAVAGIAISSALFGALHFFEYGNSWRPALLVGVSGAAFGCVRHFSGSTRAAVIAHSVFNGLTFVAMFTQGAAAGH